jgi:hypothetical protein
MIKSQENIQVSVKYTDDQEAKDVLMNFFIEYFLRKNILRKEEEDNTY